MDPIKKIDDPRLTAYALGELHGEDAAAVERFLADNPDAQAAVDEVRALGGMLSAELADESAPGLSQSQRDAISAQAAGEHNAGGDAGTATANAAIVCDAATAQSADAPVAPVTRIRLGRQFAAAAAILLVATTSFWILPGLFDKGEEGSLGFRFFGESQPAPKREVVAGSDDADDGWTTNSERDLVARSPTSGQARGRALSPMGYTSGDSEGAATEEALDADDLRTLMELGYVGSDEAEDFYRSGASRGGGGRSSPAASAKPEVSEQLGVAAGDDASSEKQAGGFSSPYANATGEPGATPRGKFLHMGPLPRTSTAGMILDAEEGFNFQTFSDLGDVAYLGASVDDEVPSAPSNPAGAAGTGSGKTANKKQFNSSIPTVGEPAKGPLVWDPAKNKVSHGRSMLSFDDGPRSTPSAGSRAEADSVAAFDSGYEAVDKRAYDAARRTGGEGYAPLHDNPFVAVAPSNPLTRLSTFGVDVDRASYSNVRRFLQRNQLPPANAVRLEELVNAFEYSDPAPAPDSEVPFAVHVSSASAPWAPQHRLVRVALKGRVIEKAERPPAQLTFLVDVSGSMKNQDKLPLLKQSLRLLVDQLDERDHVALVTYASGSKVVLPSTSAGEKATILAAIDALSAGGSTHASAGLQLAYEVAESTDFGDGGTRRVLLCTDGDFNVGVVSQQGLHDLIAEKAKTGTFLTVLGFGSGNYQDVTAETLADRGNGQYAYIDGLDEAHHVFVRQLTGTLVTIAQDVKLQLEFNPARVRAWRQLGYENRQMAAQDFRNDKKDAGEIGAGHSVVAYYEIVPTGVPVLSGTADLKYEAAVPEAPAELADDVSPELLTVNLRWKHPGAKPSDAAAEFNTPFTDGEAPFAQASDDFRFGAAVLAFGMALRSSPHAGHWPLGAVSEAARGARGSDPEGQRAEFVNLVLRAQGLLPASVANDRLSPAEIDELKAMGYWGGDDR